ncbi:MAG: hypothetical protein DMG49_21120 [Acidobacteria bacterium]|nr:MAG: hypothetical protein DMG49_21120 [Acidobacteriota bacterium]
MEAEIRTSLIMAFSRLAGTSSMAVNGAARLAGETDHNYDLTANKGMLRQTKRASASTGVKVNDMELARIETTPM